MQGSVANVPLDVYKTQDAIYGCRLPHMLSDTQSVLLRLKRKLAYKGYYMANIRPGYVMAAMEIASDPPGRDTACKPPQHGPAPGWMSTKMLLSVWTA